MGLYGFEVWQFVVSAIGLFLSGLGIGFKIGSFVGERRPVMQSRKPVLCGVPVEVKAAVKRPFVFSAV